MSIFSRQSTAAVEDAFDAPTTAVEDITGAYAIDTTHTRLGFSARHAMVTTVRGGFKDFAGTATIDAADPSKSSRGPHHPRGLASTPVSPTATGTCVSGDFFDAEAYPELTFSSTSVERDGDDLEHHGRPDHQGRHQARHDRLRGDRLGQGPVRQPPRRLRGRDLDQPQGLGPDLERRARDRRRPGVRQGQARVRRLGDPAPPPDDHPLRLPARPAPYFTCAPGGPAASMAATMRDPAPRLAERPLTLADARAVYEVMAAAELDDIGMVEIEEADIVGDWARPSFDVVGADHRRLRRRPPRRRTPRSPAPTAATRPSTRRTAAAASAPALAGWMQDTARARGSSDRSACRCRRGATATGCSTALGYRVRRTSWVLKLPEGADDRRARAARGLRRPRGDPTSTPPRTRRRGRVPRVVGARARDLRGLRGLDHGPARLRAVEPPRRGRRGRRGRRRRLRRHRVDRGRPRPRGVHLAARRPPRPARPRAWPRP